LLFLIGNEWNKVSLEGANVFRGRNMFGKTHTTHT